MTEVSFYHLEKSSLEQALPRLLERAQGAGLKTVVKLGSPERVEALNAHLWTYAQGSFLPHGSARDGRGEDQPVWLTDGDDNPAGAPVLILADGAETADPSPFERVLEIFDGRDDAALARAREHWQAYKAIGFGLTYYRQNAQGAWEKQDI